MKDLIMYINLELDALMARVQSHLLSLLLL